MKHHHVSHDGITKMLPLGLVAFVTKCVNLCGLLEFNLGIKLLEIVLLYENNQKQGGVMCVVTVTILNLIIFQ